MGIKNNIAAIIAESSVTHNNGKPFFEVSTPSTLPPPQKKRTSMTRSVLANWAGHIVFILGGFILPRLINDHLGQEQLGVWDFGWSTITYLNLLSAGVASSVNQYVAKYRASSQWLQMGKAISCCACIFSGSAIMGVTITIILVYILPWISPPTFLPYLKEMQMLLLCLGLSVSIELLLPTYVGIISGCQRFDLLAFIETGCYLILLGWIVLILLFGGDLALLGVPILCMRGIEGLLKRIVALRLCPLLTLSPALISWQGLKAVFAFGGKTLLETIAKIGLYQGNNMLIAYLFGPAALAIYARSMTLILHTNKLLFHFARVFAPSASHYKATGDTRSLQALLLNSAQNGAFITLPLVLIFGIVGSSLLRIWMGPGYAELAVLPILTIGHYFSQAQAGTFYVLMGMNHHGRASLIIFVCSLSSLIISILLVKYFHLNLLGIGISVSLAATIPYVTAIPHIAAKTIEVPLHTYFLALIQKPFLLCLPTAFCLIAARQLAGPNDYHILAIGLGSGILILGVMYWKWVLPDTMKCNIIKNIWRRNRI
jgi:O-antigen/teichoic acid export membrane protein